MKQIISLWVIIQFLFVSSALSNEVFNKDIEKSALKKLPEALKGDLKIWEADIKQIRFSHYTLPLIDDPKDLAYRTEIIMIDVYVPKDAVKLTKTLNETLRVLDAKSKNPESVQHSIAETYIIDDSQNCWLVHRYSNLDYCVFQLVEGLRFKDDQVVYKVLKDDAYFRANGDLELEENINHKASNKISKDNKLHKIEGE